MLAAISFAAGCLLGNVFFHLLPATSNFPLVLFGLLSFFLLEKVLRWHHCHEPDHHHLTSISLVGGFVHSLIDGALVTTGLGALLAVILHEVPQKITYYSIFVHQKNPPLKSLLLSLSTSLPALISAVFFYFVNYKFKIINYYLVPFTAGSFLYIAASDLIPELHRHEAKLPTTLVQFFFLLLGLFSIYLFGLFE